MRRLGFTILELLMVFAIIVVLTSMIIATINHVRQKALILETESRMQNVLDGLSLYNQDSGQVALALQIYCNLGGVGTFSNVDIIHNHNRTVSGSADPKYVAMPGMNGMMWPYGSSQNNVYWDRLIDVLPQPGQVVQSAWYEQIWPFQWPDSDWRNGTLVNPPILRFPWGRPGLRLDGTPCDPAIPDTQVVGSTIEFHDVNGWMDSNFNDPSTYNTITFTNTWVGYGSSSSLSPYTWSTGAGSQDAPVAGAVIATRSDGSTFTTTANQPLPFDLGLLSPMQTISFLQVAAILPLGSAGADAYRNDRSPKRPWNDSWGNPLVVSYAIFQPERYFRTYDAENRRDLLLKSALKAYSFNRAVYFSVGALGPKLDSTFSMSSLASSTGTPSDAPLLQLMWQQISRICKAQTWTEQSFTNPPWRGITASTVSAQTCFLSNPIEVH